VTEIIWHFAGYLHITQEFATTSVTYQGGAKFLHDDYVLPLKETPYVPDDDDPFNTLSLRPPGLPGPDDLPLPHTAPFDSTELDDTPPAHKVGVTPPAAFPKVMASSSGGVDQAFKIQIVYEQGGEQMLLQARQLNQMEDNDQVVVNPHMVPALPHLDIAAT